MKLEVSQNGLYVSKNLGEVPHPLVTETMERLKTLPIEQRKKVYFIHLNHTNPLLNPLSKEYKQLILAGYRVAKQGQKITL